MALSASRSRPAIFVDKDGTLVENVPFNVDPAKLRLMDGAAPALLALLRAGYALVMVSNQSGIGLGHFGLLEFETLMQALRRELRAEGGVVLLDELICPHAPGSLGEPVCGCRKPMPGMLLRAAKVHGLDLSSSWMIGDTLDDVEAGHRAGCRAILFDSGGETLWRRSRWREPDAVFQRWDQVAQGLRMLNSAPN